MRRHLTVNALLLLSGCATVPAATPSASTPMAPRGVTAEPRSSDLAALRSTIDSAVNAPAFANAHWGILIVDPATGDTLYSRNAGKLFMPASNMKIITGAVALSQLGADFRYRTVLATRGRIRDGVLHGDLLVIGRGDPTISVQMRKDAMAPLRELADSLRNRGITRIAGRVISEGDVFPDSPLGFGWAWDDLDYPYAAGIDELLFNEGFTTVTVVAGRRPGDAVRARTTPATRSPVVRVTATTVARAVTGDTTTVTRIVARIDSTNGGVLIDGQIAAGDSTVETVAHKYPGEAYLAALREALEDGGITIAPTAERRTDARRRARVASDSAAPADTLVRYISPPLREILPPFEKPSQNQIGEVLFKTLGLEKTGIGTADSGRRVVERQLEAWGAREGGFVIRDGSGLSRHDYLTPETIVRVLDTIRADTAFSAFYDALPIAGVDGTIARRMKGTPAEGNVRAKTGYIDRARSLSGYVTTADGRLLIFSVLSNNWTTKVADVEAVQNMIASRLAGLHLGPASGR